MSHVSEHKASISRDKSEKHARESSATLHPTESIYYNWAKNDEAQRLRNDKSDFNKLFG